MVQEIVLFPLKAGVTKEQAQKVLNQAQALGENYLKIMRSKRIYGDVSFLVEIERTIYLISYYISEQRLQHRTDIKVDEIKNDKIREYYEVAAETFDMTRQVKALNANSFWIDVHIKEKIG